MPRIYDAAELQKAIFWGQAKGYLLALVEVQGALSLWGDGKI